MSEGDTLCTKNPIGGSRRSAIDDNISMNNLPRAAPVVALAYADGIVMLTVSRGTPKLYEIYDRIALGGMGHPADLEKLRFTLLKWPTSRGSIGHPRMSPAARHDEVRTGSDHQAGV